MVNENIKYSSQGWKLNIPVTATVAFYDEEIGQNLTFSEWKALNNCTNEVCIVNQGEIYRSWKANENYASYGPGDNLVSISGPGSSFWLMLLVLLENFPE